MTPERVAELAEHSQRASERLLEAMESYASSILEIYKGTAMDHDEPQRAQVLRAFGPGAAVAAMIAGPIRGFVEASLPKGRATALVLTKIDEAAMWSGTIQDEPEPTSPMERVFRRLEP